MRKAKGELNGAHEFKMTHAIRSGLIGESSSDTFANTSKKVKEMVQGFGVFSAKGFEKPGAMYPEETISIVGSLDKGRR